MKTLRFKIKLSAAALCILFCSHASGQTLRLKNANDSLSYAIGVNMGTSLKKMGNLPIDIKVLTVALQDCLQSKELIENSDAYNIVSNYYEEVVPARNAAESQQFLEDVIRQNPNVRKTDSGLLYEILEPGDMSSKPTDDDTVVVNYKMMHRNGEVFDSHKPGEEENIPLNAAIKGWSEGIKLIGKGGRIMLWIPADLAYGTIWVSRVIQPNEVLVADVRLVDIKHGDGEQGSTQSPSSAKRHNKGRKRDRNED